MPVLPPKAEKFYTVRGFYPEIFSLLRFQREILHSCKRNFTQFAFVLYAVSFYFTIARRARVLFTLKFAPFQREKNQLVPAPLLWYPSSIKTCTRRKNAAGRLVFPPDRCRFHREKSPRFARKISTFTEKNVNVFREILHTPYIY